MFTDLQSEKEIIGNLINDHDSVLDVMGYLVPEDFTNQPLGKAFGCFINSFNVGDRLDHRTLAERAEIDTDLLAECIEAGWLTANIKFRAKKLVELAHKRRTNQECRKLVAELPNLDSQEISARLSVLAAHLALKGSGKMIYSSTDLCNRVIDLQKSRVEAKGEMSGAMTGFELLDRSIRGMKPKRATFIAAGTGFGKTTLALNIFHNVVLDGKKCLFLSNENDVDDNLDRLCGVASGHDLKEIETGSAYEAVTFKFVDKYKGKTAFISDNSPRNIDEVCAIISKHAIQDHIEVAVVDYIGEISGNPKDRENEEAKLARYGQQLIDCAKAMNVHLIILAQLNREGNKPGKPGKTELGGCFRLAQKAHTMLLFWQDENKIDVISIEKNRQGPAGISVAVHFNRNTQRIAERGIYLEKDKEIMNDKGEACPW